MKIALCLFGHIGGMKSINGSIVGEGNISRVYNSYKNMVIGDNDVDLFIHSWSVDDKKRILDVYKPNDSLIEKQKDFSNVRLDDYSMKDLDSYSIIFKSNPDKAVSKLQELAIRSSSRWYSNSKALEIMGKYSRDNKIEYDFVFQGRLDLLLFRKFDFSSMDRQFFYCPIREIEKGKTVNEFFLVSSQKNAELFGEIYKNKNKYSIRPAVAAKQHLDIHGIKTREIFEFIKDFNILRLQEEIESKPRLSERIFKAIRNPMLVTNKIINLIRK